MWEKKYARVSDSHTYIKKNLDFFEEKKTHGSHTKKTSRLVRKKSHSHIHSHTKFQFSSVQFPIRNLVQIFGRVPSATATSRNRNVPFFVLKVHNRDQTWMNLAFESQLYILILNKNVFCTYVRVIKITCMIFFFDLWLAIHLIVISLFI